MSDSSIAKAFSAVCYFARKEDRGAISRKQLVKFAKRAIDQLAESASPDDLVDDIIDITCLILHDGEDYRFIHRSVQEFHSACHVSAQPDQNAKLFYGAMQHRWYSWKAELEFLAVIDEYRFWRFFGIPELETLLEEKPTTAYVRELFKSDQIGVSRDGSRVSYSFTFSSNNWFRYQWFRQAKYRSLFPKGENPRLKEYILQNGLQEGADDEDDTVSIFIDALIDADVLSVKDFRPLFEEWKRQLADARAMVQRVESQNSDFDFD